MNLSKACAFSRINYSVQVNNFEVYFAFQLRSSSGLLFRDSDIEKLRSAANLIMDIKIIVKLK